MRRAKPVTRRQEIRHLKERIAELKDSHRMLLRKDVTPLMKRLLVLQLAEKLARAERALVRSIESDKGSPQLELLGLDGAAQAGELVGLTTVLSPKRTEPDVRQPREAELHAPLLARAERLGQ